jgi:hypothetical protein
MNEIGNMYKNMKSEPDRMNASLMLAMHSFFDIEDDSTQIAIKNKITVKEYFQAKSALRQIYGREIR